MTEYIGVLFTWLSQNQFLAGGIGTVLFGAVLYLVRQIPVILWGWVTRACTVVLTVTTRNSQFEEVAELLNKHKVNFLMRNFTPGTEGSSITPGFGYGWAYYKGVLILFERKMLDSKFFIEQQVELSFITRRSDILQQFMSDANHRRDPNTIRIHASSDSYFEGLPHKRKRSLDTVFIPETTKRTLVDRFNWFLNNEDWYVQRGIPYKLCGILHGPPGTGKTSLVHAIASKFDFQIKYITSLTNIDSLVRGCGRKDLIVIEDIDALADNLDRDNEDESENKEKKDKVAILHKLLNSLDGFQTPHGLKVLMTTNHPEKLDEAIKRPGRTDFLLEIGPLEKDDIISMFERFYGQGTGEPLLHARVQPHTGSYLQQLFTTRDRDDAIGVLSHVELKAVG